VRRLPALVPIAASIVLHGCATPPPTTRAYIEAGAALLEPGTVALDAGSKEKITARVTVEGEHKQVWVRASDCSDAVGYIATAEDTLFVFANGDKPADRLFVEICDIQRHRAPVK